MIGCSLNNKKIDLTSLLEDIIEDSKEYGEIDSIKVVNRTDNYILVYLSKNNSLVAAYRVNKDVMDVVSIYYIDKKYNEWVCEVIL